ncbi:MAG TPA: sulfite exporter TauE/SafE family protein [Solirubrobacterales bacterium]|nr:sulfite exporter TauE/SafE family protein [Solirubrobacterales bacterium]
MSSVAAALMGFAGGMVGGLLGVGGGILFVPALAIFMDESQVRAEATSLLAIVPVAMVAVWRQLGYGNVRVREGLVIGALSPLGVGIGVVVANAVSQRALELIFGCLALVIAAQLVIRALRPPAPTKDPAPERP